MCLSCWYYLLHITSSFFVFVFSGTPPMGIQAAHRGRLQLPMQLLLFPSCVFSLLWYHLSVPFPGSILQEARTRLPLHLRTSSRSYCKTSRLRNSTVETPARMSPQRSTTIKAWGELTGTHPLATDTPLLVSSFSPLFRCSDA